MAAADARPLRVAVRVRPALEQDYYRQSAAYSAKTARRDLAVVWKAVGSARLRRLATPTELRLTPSLVDMPLAFDLVFGDSTSNTQVFDCLVKDVVDSVVRGTNGCASCRQTGHARP